MDMRRWSSLVSFLLLVVMVGYTTGGLLLLFAT